MSSIFISHSSKDNEIAGELKNRLDAQGQRSVFLDFDPEIGIPPGRDWEQELYQQLRSCQAVIVLCSKDSMASQWCFAEITHAKALGKQIFPIKIGDCTINTVLTSRQVIDLMVNKEDAYQMLLRGLKVAGLDPASSFDWDGSRPPYPGLMAFQEEDAAIFFGRDAEIQQGLELLNRIRQFRGARMVLVLGASGSGKSSLVRAGMLPRMRKNNDQWLIADPFRPRDDPFKELAIVLASAFSKYGKARDWQNIRDELKQAAAIQPLNGKYLNDLAEELRILSGRREASVLFVIDQTEELPGLTDGKKDEGFMPFLRAALDDPGSPLMVICTLRSDFLGNFQQLSAVRGMASEDLRVGSMSVDSLVQVIEGPAEVAGVELEPGLSQVMVKDTETNDALPLLAFTLRELYEHYADDRKLTVEEYRDKLGGLAGSVAKAAEAVFRAKPLTEDEQADFRKSLLSMVSINEEGKFVRLPVRWKELPERIYPMLERFVQARLLVSGGEGKDRFLEVAHEALFRSWDRLKVWLNEDREFLLWRKRLDEAYQEWERTGKDKSALLSGHALAEGQNWFDRRGDQISSGQSNFVRSSIDADKHSRHIKTGIVAAIFIIILLAGGVSYYQWQQAEIQKVKAEDLLRFAIADYWSRDPTTAVAVLQEVKKPNEIFYGKEILDNVLNLAIAIFEFREYNGYIKAASFNRGGDRVVAVSSEGTASIWQANGSGDTVILKVHNVSIASFSPRGDRVLTVLWEGTAQIWQADGYGEPVILNQTNVSTASFSPSGDRVLTASGAAVRIWQADGYGEPVILNQTNVNIASFSPSGDRVLTASGANVRIWQADGKGEPVILNQTNVSTASFSPSGDRVLTVVVPSDRPWEGTAQIWQADGKGEPVILNQTDVSTASFSPSGDRILTASDAAVQIWRADGKGEPVILNQTNVRTASFSPSGDRVLIGSEATVRIWQADGSGEPDILNGPRRTVNRGGPRTGHIEVNVVTASFSPNGDRVLTVYGGGSHTTRIWPANIFGNRTIENATNICLDPEFRLQYFGESMEDATQKYEQCEREHGRNPKRGNG